MSQFGVSSHVWWTLELEDPSAFIKIIMCVDKDSVLVLLPYASTLVLWCDRDVCGHKVI